MSFFSGPKLIIYFFLHKFYGVIVLNTCRTGSLFFVDFKRGNPFIFQMEPQKNITDVKDIEVRIFVRLVNIFPNYNRYLL